MKLHKLALALGVVFGGSLLITACSDGGSTPATQYPLTSSLSQVTTPIQVRVVDGSGAQVTDAFTVTITGTDSSKVVDATGAVVTTATTQGGNLLLTLKSGTTLPANFNVMLTGAGYLPTGKSVTVSATGSTIDVTVPVVKTPTTAGDFTSGTGVNGNMSTASGVTGGQAPADLLFKTSDTKADNSIDSQVKLAIPSTVKMLDASGNPVSGTITGNVVSFTPNQDTALAAFPGGFAVNVTDPNSLGNGSGAGTFVSGGFAAYNLVDSNGKTVKTFSAPVTATIVVPKSTTKPDGSAIAVNDTLPIWSYNESTGKWVAETNGTVKSLDANGNYVVEFQTSHLSYWNMDWFSSANCTATFQITKFPVNASRVDLTTKFASQAGYLYSGYATDTTPFKVYNAPAGKPVKITVSVPGGGSQVFDVADMCAGTVSIDASGITAPVPGDVGGKVYEACFNNNVEVPNTRRGLAAPVYIWGYSGSNYVYRSTTAAASGSYSMTSLLPGSYTVFAYSPRIYDVSYSLQSYYYGYKYSQVVTAGATTSVPDFVFPMNCANATGVTGGTGGSN